MNEKLEKLAAVLAAVIGVWIVALIIAVVSWSVWLWVG